MVSKAPIFRQLLSHIKNDPVSFHVPGHKMGKGFNPNGKAHYKEILKLDLTELTGLDNLHQTEGIIQEAQLRARNIYQSDHSFFLVNGSTVGNMSMILSVCQPGDKIIVQRNVHKSVINALILARAIPIYIYPNVIESIGVPASPLLHQIEKALVEHPDSKAIFIMNPNYYGVGIDLSEVAKEAHKYGIPLLVDEAHGAHFGLHRRFPKSAIQQGADAVVQSTHKTLTAMTMGSILHIKSQYIDLERIKLFLSMLQTSSPSYPIMASLDLTLQWIEEKGEELWQSCLQGLDGLYRQTIHFSNINLEQKLPNNYFQDPLKIIINAKSFTGYELQRLLEQDNIFIELADNKNIVGVATIGSTEYDFNRLLNTLVRIESMNNNRDNGTKLPKIPDNLLENKHGYVSLEKVLYGEKETVSLPHAVGRIAGEMVIPYPPGIPIIQLGEKISLETINYLKQIKEQGANFSGLSDPTFQSIRVLK